MLNDHAERNCEDIHCSDIRTDEFFEEILLTYRLLFGQDERSWRAFMRMVNTSEEDGGEDKPWNCDPLLVTLCGRSCSSEGAKKIYDEIEAEEPTDQCDPQTEFPFFGSRLVDLHEFVKQHQPQTVRGLLTDKRDINIWYNLWSNQVRVPFSLSIQLYFFDANAAPCFLRYLYHLPHDSVFDLPNMAGNPSKRSAQPALNPYTLDSYVPNLSQYPPIRCRVTKS